jgi:hypothetical protein
MDWIAGIAILAFVAYKKGLGAWVGVCPSGYTAGSDMFPTCFNDLVTAYDQSVTAVKTVSDNPALYPQLAPPALYGWDGSKIVVVKNPYL